MSQVGEKEMILKQIAEEFQTELQRVIAEQFPGKDLEALAEPEVDAAVGPAMQAWFMKKFKQFKEERSVIGAMMLQVFAEHLARVSNEPG